MLQKYFAVMPNYNNNDFHELSSGESEPENADSDEEVIEIDNSVNYVPGYEVFHNSYFYPSVKEFSGPSSHISANALLNLSGNEPINYFELFFDNNLLDLIVRETNIYQSQNPEPIRKKMKPWEDLTRETLREFIGLTALMGHVKKVSLEDYWSTKPILYTPIFHKIMTRNRYLQILRFIHFQNNETVLKHPLRKIKVIIDDLNEKFAKFLDPGKKLCIDESLLLWKGKLRFKQFLPLKRNRFGIKIFLIVDCESGYILGFIVYTGESTEYEKFNLGVSGDIVAHFMKPYFGKGHIVFLDNWYNSPILAEFLHEKDTGVCGTLRKCRKGVPKFTTSLKKGESEVAHNMIWMVIRWLDKKEVYVITTVHEFGYAATGKKHYETQEDILKPACIIDYNKNMGGVDNVDRQLALSESVRKTTKWYRKLFWHLVDLALINALALYKLEVGYISYSAFREKVICSLLKIDNLENYSPDQIDLLPARLTARHFAKKNEDGKRKRCVVCASSKIRAESIYRCEECNVALCVCPCFEMYHTLRNL